MIELGVNIDHVATLRQARRTYEPDPVWAAVEAHLGGADGITVHLREDRRHIQDEDVRRLRELVHIKLNLEMAATDGDGRHRLRAEAGDGDARARGPARDHDRRRARRRRRRRRKLAGVVAAAGRRPASSPACSSTPSCAQVEAAARIGARVCEIHTGPYAHAFHAKGRDPESAAVVAELDEDPRRRARRSARAGMRFNAGHALNYFNVQPVAALPGVRELHIGHAIVVARGVRRPARGGAPDEGADPGGARRRRRGARAMTRACRAGPVDARRRRPRARRPPTASGCCIRWSAA